MFTLKLYFHFDRKLPEQEKHLRKYSVLTVKSTCDSNLFIVTERTQRIITEHQCFYSRENVTDFHHINKTLQLVIDKIQLR